MPQIIVAADRGAAFGEGAVTFRERVNVTDFESEHFAAQLVERLGWAVEDADVVERRQDEPAKSGEEAERPRKEPAAERPRREPVAESPRQETVDEAQPAGETDPGRTPLGQTVQTPA
jgi:hypothetical protein